MPRRGEGQGHPGRTRWLERDEDTWEGQGWLRWDKDTEEGHGQLRIVSEDEDGQWDDDPGEGQGHLEWTTVIGLDKDG